MKTDPPDEPVPEMEVLLRRLPQPDLPAAWRAPILRAAGSPFWPWLTRPVQIGLAAAWACIGLMWLTMPPVSVAPPMVESAAQPGHFVRPRPPLDWPEDFDLAWVQP